MSTLTAVPDSALARAADTFVTSVEPAFLVNHSRRTFQFGAALLGRAGRSFDRELLYVASILHDVTLGTELDDGVTPFHLRAAALAARRVLDAGRTDEDARLVFDAIALHLDVITADDARPEVAGTYLGAVADVLGLRVDELSPAWLGALVEAHPRLGMKAALAELVAAEIRQKPYSPFATVVGQAGVIDLIAAAPFDD